MILSTSTCDFECDFECDVECDFECDFEWAKSNFANIGRKYVVLVLKKIVSTK